MLRSNLNWLNVLWKKLNRVKDCVIVSIVKFWRTTHRQGEDEEGGFQIFLDLNPMFWSNLDWAPMLID